MQPRSAFCREALRRTRRTAPARRQLAAVSLRQGSSAHTDISLRSVASVAVWAASRNSKEVRQDVWNKQKKSDTTAHGGGGGGIGWEEGEQTVPVLRIEEQVEHHR